MCSYTRAMRPSTANAAALAAVVALFAGFLLLRSWGTVLVAGALLPAALAARRASPRPARAAGLAVLVAAPLVLVAAFVIRHGAENLVTAGQKAAGKSAVASLRTLLWAEDRAVERHGRAALLAELVRDDLMRPEYGQLTGNAVTVGGYTYAVYVRTPDGATTDGGAPPPAGALEWIAYAWPASLGASGTTAFCLNRYEDILQTDNATQGYDGAHKVPAWDACVADRASPRLTEGTGGDGARWTWWQGKRTRRSLATDG